MPTFGQIKAKVSKKLVDPNNTAISASDVGDAINDAIRFWRYQRFWFNEASTVLTMDINDPYVLQFGNTKALYPAAPVLPSDFLYEDTENGFVINDNGQSYSITKVLPQAYDASITSEIGLPSIYTFRAGNYEFLSLPNIAYALNVYYIKNYADLVNDADSNDFTTHADQLITYEALSRLTGEDRQDLQMNNSYAAKADRESKSLLRRTTKQTASGDLTVDTIL